VGDLPTCTTSRTREGLSYLNEYWYQRLSPLHLPKFIGLRCCIPADYQLNERKFPSICIQKFYVLIVYPQKKNQKSTQEALFHLISNYTLCFMEQISLNQATRSILWTSFCLCLNSNVCTYRLDVIRAIFKYRYD